MKHRHCLAALFAATAFPVFAQGVQGALADEADIARLRLRALQIPVVSVQPSELQDSYLQARGGGLRSHEALDIMVRRGTPVVALEDGHIAKMFLSRPGGLTVYHFDDAREFSYYYAHLDRYVDGLREGMRVQKGQVIGYVGSTGNAAPASPHLHFAIFRLGPERQWWRGTPINPYRVWSSRPDAGVQDRPTPGLAPAPAR